MPARSVSSSASTLRTKTRPIDVLRQQFDVARGHALFHATSVGTDTHMRLARQSQVSAQLAQRPLDRDGSCS